MQGEKTNSMKIVSSQELFQRAQQVAPGGVHSPVRAFKGVGGNPIFFEKSEGAYLYSCDGKKYLDLCMSFGPLLLGHRDPDVANCVHRMVDTVWTLGAPEPYSTELGEWIKGAVPWLERVRFVNSGTEAVMTAIRLARAATQRNKIIKFIGCYHGHADSLLVKAGSGLAGVSASSSAGIPETVITDTLLLPLDQEDAVEEIFLRHKNEIAALIIEPLPANNGLLLQRKDFLQKIATLTKKHGALLILDEVISGFRVGKGGMAEKLDIIPDLVTYGKIIGGGFPVGAYGGRKEIMDLVAPLGNVYQAGTLSANPIGMVAGLATLSKAFSGEKFSIFEKRANDFYEKMNSLIQNKDIPLQLIQYGSIFWLHYGHRNTIRNCSDISEQHPKWFQTFFHACLENGIYLPPNAYEVFFLSQAHTEVVLESLLQAFEKSLDASMERFS